jgi:hypothetical protein
MSEPKKYFGKYRGTVVNNADPELRARIQVMVAEISGFALHSWALPCFPIGGPLMGMFSVPIQGSGVWVEFEHGDIDHPIWTGVFWGSTAEVPALSHLIPPVVPGFVMQTPLKTGILVSDVPGPTGGIMLTTASGAMILINDVGITLSNGQGASIQMIGPQVTINGGALTII